MSRTTPAALRSWRRHLGIGAGVVLVVLVSNYAAGSKADPAQGEATGKTDSITLPSESAENETARLMAAAEAQIAAGRLSEPAGDNAVETLEAILRRTTVDPQINSGVINSMASRFEELALAADAAGRNEEAARFRAFRNTFAPREVGLGENPIAQDQQIATAEGDPASPSTTLSFAPLGSGSAASDSSTADPAPKPPEPPASPAVPGTEFASLPSQAATDTQPARSSADTTAGVRPDELSDDRVAAQSAMTVGTPEAPVPASRAAASAPSTPDSALATRLISRADSAIAQLDINAARLLYSRAAADSGSGRAKQGLARTFDPVFLRGIGARGIQADAALAERWYEDALAAGANEAAEALRRLRRWKAETTQAEGSRPPNR